MKKKYILHLFQIFNAGIIFLICSSSFAFYVSMINGEKLLQYCNPVANLTENKQSVNIASKPRALCLEKKQILDSFNENLKFGICVGYLLGFEDMHSFYTIILTKIKYPNKKIFLYCLPSDVGPAQLAKIIVKYLNDHPEKLNQPAMEVIDTAFSLYFPCTN